jgi:4-amino-4-deoxy-L-arabinose transferase-like glycosyltransferase
VTSKSKTQVHLLLTVAIILLGWSLALTTLGSRSLWADEGATAKTALETHSLAKALELHEGYHFLHLSLMMAIVRVNRSEFALRWPSAVAAVLALPIVYQLGRCLLSRMTGLVAAFLLAISPFALGYAQEARVYALLEMLACLSLLLLTLALQRRRWFWWAGFAFGTTLLLYSHFFAWFAVGAEVIFALVILLHKSIVERHLDKRLLGLVGSLLAVALLYLPLVPSLLAFVQANGPGSGSVQGAGLKPFQLSLNFLRDMIAFFGSKRWKWQLYLFGASLLLGFASTVAGRKWKTLLLIILWFAVPLAVLTAVQSAHFFDYRYLIFLLPMYLITVAEGVTGTISLLARVRPLSRLPNANLLLTLILTIALFVPANLPTLRAQYGRQKENWRGIGLFLRAQRLPDEAIYVTPLFWANPLRFYQPSLEPSIVGGSATDLKQLQTAAERHAGLWYLRLIGPLGDPTGKLSEWISAQHFDLLIDASACGYGIYVYYRRFDELATARQAELLRQAAAFCPTDPRFQSPPP